MFPEPLRRLIQLLARLPGVGERTAQRFALHLIGNTDDFAGQLSRELAVVAERVRPCERCGNIAELEDGKALCAICRDARRDRTLLCIVHKVQDLLAVERSGVMKGQYLVLGRLLSPLDGIGPAELPLRQIEQRISDDGVKEVIIATPPSVDGEATALLLARELGRLGVNMSRIASGVPHGGDLEYADQITLGRAIDGRKKMGETG